MSGESFAENTGYMGTATCLRCPKTGHEFVVLAPSVDALETILALRCNFDPTGLNPDKYRRVKLQPTEDKEEAAPKQEPDWKEIAIALARECRFVIEQIHSRDATNVINTTTGEFRHWKESIMDAVELIPGIKYDREAVHALSLPRKEREKWFKTNRPEQKETKS